MKTLITLSTEQNDHQIYEVLRHDGSKDYYVRSKGDDDFYPFGGGMSIKSFDAESIKPIDHIPSDMTKGFAHFDGEVMMKAYVNEHDRWNGWFKPYIHIESMEQLCKDLCCDEETYIFVDRGEESRLFYVHDDDSVDDYELGYTEIEGELYFYMGDFALCFDFDLTNINL